MIPDTMWTILMGIITYVDIKYKKIPDVLTVSVFLCAVFRVFGSQQVGIVESFAGGMVGGIVFFVILMLKPGTFGGGDIKLSMANGMYLGVGRFFDSFIIAVLLAGIYVLVGLLTKKISRKSEVAFGPFLCVGALMAKYIM